MDKRREFLNRFWQIISKVHGFGSAKAKSSTVLAQPVVLKALAKLGFDLAFGHQHIRDEEGYKTLCAAIIDGSLDFSHANNIWQAAFFLATKGEKVSIRDYLNLFTFLLTLIWMQVSTTLRTIGCASDQDTMTFTLD